MNKIWFWRIVGRVFRPWLLTGILLSARLGSPQFAWAKDGTSRDALDLFAFHCDVPEGAAAVEAELMYAIPPFPPVLDVSLGVVASSKLAFLNWNALLLYPEGKKADEYTYAARLKLPAGWKHAS